MKYLTLHVIFLIVMTFTVRQMNAQDLRGSVQGKWTITEYQTQSGKQSVIDTLEFKSDGAFLSDSIYFKTRKGLYRTDENRSVVILEVNGESTEWITSIRMGILSMRSTPASKRQPTIYITASRIEN